MSWPDVLGSKLLVKKGDTVEEVATSDVIKDKKYVVLYFSASVPAHLATAGPCRKFTPLLSVVYEDQAEKNAEVIFVSNDSDIDGFNEYFAEMPWTAIPFTSDDVRDNLGGKYDVAGIPRVVVLSATDGTVINIDARNVIVAKKSLDGAF